MSSLKIDETARLEVAADVISHAIGHAGQDWMRAKRDPKVTPKQVAELKERHTGLLALSDRLFNGKTQAEAEAEILEKIAPQVRERITKNKATRSNEPRP